MLTGAFLRDPVLSRSRRKPSFEVEHFPTKAVTDVGGWVGVPPTTASNVGDQLSTSDFIRSVQARRFSLSIFFPDQPCLTYISDDEQYAAD